MGRQLRVARGPFARGLVVGALPATGIVQVINGVTQRREFEFTISSRGPGTFFDITGTVVTSDGRRHSVITPVPRLDNASGTQSGTLALTAEQARAAWFVVTWVASHRGGIRTEGYRLRVLGKEPPVGSAASRSKTPGRDECDEGSGARYSERPVEVFRWDWTSRGRNRAWMRVRRWVPAWVRRAAPKKLVDRFQRSGCWRELPPAVPVLGIWPGLREDGRWY